MAPSTDSRPEEVSSNGKTAADVLRSSAILSRVEPSKLQKIVTCGRVGRFPTGTSLFETGDRARAMYVIQDGFIELLGKDGAASLPYIRARLGAGELMCDIGVFTGVRHRFTAKVVEEAEVLVIPWERVKEEFNKDPELASQVCNALAHSLIATRTLLEGANGQGASFQGSLSTIDLTSLIQTLAFCDQLSGRLMVRSDENVYLGEIVISGGQAKSARCELFHGDDALVAMLIDSPSTGKFYFFESTADIEINPDDAVASPTATLLMDVARRRDELVRFRDELYTDLEARLVPKSARLTLRACDPELGLEMCERIQSGSTLGELVEGLKDSQRIELYRILHDLQESGQVGLEPAS